MRSCTIETFWLFGCRPGYPPCVLAPVGGKTIEPRQLQPSQVGKVATSTYDKLRERVSGGWRQAEPDARHSRNHHVRRVLQSVQDRPPVRRVFDHPCPAPDHANMPEP